MYYTSLSRIIKGQLSDQGLEQWYMKDGLADGENFSI